MMYHDKNMSGWFQQLEAVVRNQVIKPSISAAASFYTGGVVQLPTDFVTSTAAVDSRNAAGQGGTYTVPQIATQVASGVVQNASNQVTSLIPANMKQYMPYIECLAAGLLLALVLRK